MSRWQPHQVQTSERAAISGIRTALRRGVSRKIFIMAWLAAASNGLAQTNPTPQSLPYAQNFGTVPFSTIPAGVAAWGGLDGDNISTVTLAANSTPPADATITASSSAGTTSGSFGYASGGNAKFYIQPSGNATNGANQLAIAINTTSQSSVSLQYDVESMVVNLRTIGVLCQYRVGTSGGWTTLTASSGLNPYSQSGGATGLKTTPLISLPVTALNQPIVQIRWAIWRGTETGNSSGLAIDNISVIGNPTGNSLGISVSPSTIHENDGAGAALVTVTALSPVTADLPVTLSVSDTSEAMVVGPNPATIPAGQSSVTFTISAVDDALIDGTQTINLQATAPSTAPAATTLTVLDDEDANSPPTNYYNAAAGLSGTALKGALKTIITTGHVQYSYRDTYDPLYAIYKDPANTANVLTVYSGTSVAESSKYYSAANPDTTWSREHVWPVSFGLDPENVDPGYQNADAGPDYTDLFNLRPALQTVNVFRGNNPYDKTTGTPTVSSLAPLCSKDSNSFEPRDVEKGDLARAILYMATRYDGTDPKTIDLEVNNNPNSTTGTFGYLNTLLKWHEDDPVSSEERQRNQLTYSTYQRNRNPFIDHPEYVALIWGSVRVSKNEAAVAEGGAGDSYTLVLTSQPTANVTVNITSTPASQVVATPSSAVFTSTNWNQPQTIVLSAVDDAVYETALTATVLHSITTTDTYYSTLTTPAVSVTITDDDPLITPIPLPISFSGPWSPLPSTGYLGVGLDVYGTNLGGEIGSSGSLKFGNSGNKLTISYIGAAKTMSYRLKGNNTTTGTFLVQESPDGVSFTTVRTVTDKSSADQAYSDSLLPGSRFVSFFYQTKSAGNIQLDQLSIITSPWLAWQSLYGLSGQDVASQNDYDKDGFSNLAEYALGGSPVVSNSSITPLTERIANKTRLTAIIRTSDTALVAGAETTTDLTNPASWTTTGVQKILPVSQTGVASGFERMTFEINDSGSAKRFVRLRFDLN